MNLRPVKTSKTAARVSSSDDTIQSHCTSIRVTNLPHDITEDKLKDVFRKYGSIVSIQVSSGNATITYTRKEDVDKVISRVNNTKVCGTVVQVCKQLLFQSLNKGLTILPTTSSLKFSHLTVTNEASTETKSLKRSRQIDLVDDLPDYDDDDDDTSLPDSKKTAPSQSFSFALSEKKSHSLTHSSLVKGVYTSLLPEKNLASDKRRTSLKSPTKTNRQAASHISSTKQSQSMFSFGATQRQPACSTAANQPAQETPALYKHCLSKGAVANDRLLTQPVVKPQLVTKHVFVSPFFIKKESQYIKVTKCIEASPDKTKIVVTGEMNHVNSVTDYLENRFKIYKSKVSTRAIEVSAIYAPLFVEEIFSERIKMMSDENCVEFLVQCGTGEETVECVAQRLKQPNDGVLLLNHLFCLGLLTESVEKQWLIQRTDGTWDVIPHKTNNCFNTSAEHCHTVEQGGITYNVNLLKKTAINSATGFVHPLKYEDIRSIWSYYQDDEFGFVPYSNEESSEIEECYKTHISKPVFCHGRRCYFSFRSSAEIGEETKTMRPIRREPEVKNSFLAPSVCILLKGLERDIELVQKSFQDFLQMKKRSVPLPLSSSIGLLIESHAQQYCVLTKFNQEGHMSIEGVRSYVDRVMFELSVFKDTVIPIATSQNCQMSFSVPDEWQLQERDTDDIMVVPVNSRSAEWTTVQARWQKTMKFPIKKIERVQNKFLWNLYSCWRKKMQTKNADRDTCIERWLFHGTRSTSPKEIYKFERGFDFRRSQGGMWGNGIYFAENASYSLNYAHQLSNGDKQMFLACVLTGESIYLRSSATTKSFKMPPPKDRSDSTVLYDSVKGTTGGSDVYVVYEHDKTYPAYVITF